MKFKGGPTDRRYARKLNRPMHLINPKQHPHHRRQGKKDLRTDGFTEKITMMESDIKKAEEVAASSKKQTPATGSKNTSPLPMSPHERSNRSGSFDFERMEKPQINLGVFGGYDNTKNNMFPIDEQLDKDSDATDSIKTSLKSSQSSSKSSDSDDSSSS